MGFWRRDGGVRIGHHHHRRSEMRVDQHAFEAGYLSAECHWCGRLEEQHPRSVDPEEVQEPVEAAYRGASRAQKWAEVPQKWQEAAMEEQFVQNGGIDGLNPFEALRHDYRSGFMDGFRAGRDEACDEPTCEHAKILRECRHAMGITAPLGYGVFTPDAVRELVKRAAKAQS